MGEILTCLETRDDKARYRLQERMIKQFGYLPIYGPTIEDLWFAAHLFDHLIREYTGYQWVVEVRGGVVKVVNDSADPYHGWTEHIEKFDNDGHHIKFIGGDILDRHGLPRRALEIDLISEMPRDLRGNIARVS